MAFKKAEKQQLWLRMALHGGPGAGKTVSSILIASGIGSRIAVIDTENRSAEKATRDFPVEFDVSYLSDFHPHNYVKEIQTAVKEGYEVLIIDSLSHAWTGKGGVLEVVEQAKEKNQFTAWAKGTPLQNDLIEAIIQAPIHIIATMRSKEKYVIEKNDHGKDVPRKIGVEPIQRDGMYYEFDVCGRFDEDLNLLIEKSRALFLRNKTIHKPNAEFGVELKEWLLQGKPIPKPFICSPALTRKLASLNKEAEQMGITVERIKQAIAAQLGNDDLRSFDDEKMASALEVISELIAQSKPSASNVSVLPSPVPTSTLPYPTEDDLPNTLPSKVAPHDECVLQIKRLAWKYQLQGNAATIESFFKGLVGASPGGASLESLQQGQRALEMAGTNERIKSWAAATWKVSSELQAQALGLIVAFSLDHSEEQLLNITGNTPQAKDAKSLKTMIANLESFLRPESEAA